MKVKIYTTDISEKKYFYETTEEISETDKRGGWGCIRIFTEPRYQEITGFGGAFTDASASLFCKLPQEKQQMLIKMLFDENEGIGFSVGRTHIGSCDFTRKPYSYVSDGDETLESFSLDEDKKAVIPMLKAALEARPDLRLLASPWSPPAYMKDNGSLFGGGKLKKEYYGLWTEYVARYIEEMRAEGITINAVTIQNEAAADMTWESCVYTAEEECALIKSGFGKRITELGAQIYVWDHNKELLFDRASAVFSDSEASPYVAGAACHWYTGDHFEQIGFTCEAFPGKKIIFSEGCRSSEERGIKKISGLDFAEDYAHEIIGDLNGGISLYLTWNLMLDMENGPFHNRFSTRYCDAPVMIDSENEEIIPEPSYYYFGHFSKFIKRGARRLGVSRYTDKLEATAFINKDNSVAAVILNRTDESRKVKLVYDGCRLDTELAAHSIATVNLGANGIGERSSDYKNEI